MLGLELGSGIWVGVRVMLKVIKIPPLAGGGEKCLVQSLPYISTILDPYLCIGHVSRTKNYNNKNNLKNGNIRSRKSVPVDVSTLSKSSSGRAH